MALILDATIGGASSNSYNTQAEGDDYHDGRLFTSDWTGASTANKEAALAWATRLLDYNFDWAGGKYTIPQALRWPRFGALDRDGQLIDSAIIPVALKDAVSELARLLIIANRPGEKGTEGLAKLKADVIGLEFDKHDRTGSIPDDVYQMISHLGTLKLFTTGGGKLSSAQLLRA